MPRSAAGALAVAFLLRRDAVSVGRPNLLSTIGLRQAGFAGCRDSEDAVRHWMRHLQDRKLAPNPRPRATVALDMGASDD